MKFLTEYRNRKLTQKIARVIRKELDRPVRLMEICGTHTVAIFRNGLREMLPPGLKLLSGPGCPVCVTPQDEIDRAIELAGHAIVTTFGDMMKVPGSRSSLEKEKASGADVRVVYSVLDALDVARKNPDRQVAFIAVGFETTAPSIAVAVQMADAEKLRNFTILPCHKLVPPAMTALLNAGEVDVDGFICPGHVSAIIGSVPYEPVAKHFKTPCVITGFEPVDIMQGIEMLVRQIAERRSEVEIQYTRVVRPEGNPAALKAMKDTFEVCDARWRGLGVIPESGLKLRRSRGRFDAVEKFALKAGSAKEPAGCRCGEILRAVKTPEDCRLFGKRCTPENPVGPCMVSTEGTCAAHYKYARLPKLTRT